MRIWLGITALLLISTTGCQRPNSSDEFVARVGDAYLLQSDLDASLANLAPNFDTTQVRRQIIDQWIDNELLYQEALHLRLSNREDIKRRLDESARAVLIEGLISDYHAQADQEITPLDVATYYENNKEQLRFLEPFVHIRYLSNPSQDSLELARQLLSQATNPDSVFVTLIERFSSSPADDLEINQNYLPETRLFIDQFKLSNLLGNTEAGQLPQILRGDSLYHFLQVMARSPAGTIPELPWVETFIREQLAIRFRKQNYTRSVQNLRVEAEFREDIEIR